ncbi:MAG: hypothetical protein EOP09_07640 [Proteobacteria bacterium]|nr:MAG: hypothetical protein EOP09_07640 [Pseudomonadota bacterium]
MKIKWKEENFMGMRSFMTLLVVAVFSISMMSCKTTPKRVFVKKGSCQEVYGGALLECETVEK